jgi:hypothetical protein
VRNSLYFIVKHISRGKVPKCYREKVEAAPYGRIKDINKKLQDTNNDRKEAESSL